MKLLQRAAPMALLVLMGLGAGRAAAQAEPDLSLAPRIKFDAFKKALDAGHVVLVDVRDPAAYANGHIPGSLSIPLAQVEAQAPRLRAMKKPIVTYCA